MSFIHSSVCAFYVILWNFTEQGVKNLKDCIQSIEVFKGYMQRMGNEYHGTYYSFGQYDAVSLVEADNDNDVRYSLLQAEKQGNLRSTTLKSITHEEAIKLAESI
jgi:uncharacterized protein with GYD domain